MTAILAIPQWWMEYVPRQRPLTAAGRARLAIANDAEGDLLCAVTKHDRSVSLRAAMVTGLPVHPLVGRELHPG